MERHEDIREQLTDYVIGELPRSAREQVQAHLSQCGECAAEARELSGVFHGIGLTVPPVAPPAHLRARVLATLERERPSSSLSSVVPLSRPRGRPSVHPAWLALAATAVLVLGGMFALSQQRTARLADQLRQSEEEIARLTAEAGTIAGQADLTVAILTAPDMRRIDLAGVDSSRNATARAYWSGTRGLLIVADRLPTPPPGRTYQVWLISGGSPGPVSAGLMNGRREGRGILIVPPPRGVAGGSVTVAVTDEPEGGLPAPTGSQHLLGSL
jgi:anti-sigma-K factor RskA